jgi:nitrogen fixation/metabolism regulation signal transduction histidine kinase
VSGRRLTLDGRLAIVAVSASMIGAAIAFAAAAVFRALGVHPLTLALAAAAALAIPIVIAVERRIMRTPMKSLAALGDGVRSFRDADYSMRIAAISNDEIGELVAVYNEVADAMRTQRNDIYQKELLLDTILQGSPIAIVLVNSADRVVFANAAARELFGRATRIEGRHFHEILPALPAALREAVEGGIESIFTAEPDETYRFMQRQFHLNTQEHRLVMIERLTPELRRQEVSIWKKAIRTINHELNNSLAPISSLFHSARHVQSRPEHHHRLDEIYSTIEERLLSLREFLDSYADFARLPAPRKTWERWDALLDDVRGLYPFGTEGTIPDEGFFDRGQLQQVLINLLKNAQESGTEEVVVSIVRNGDGTLLRVLDGGRGMDEAVMRQALLPFYSTKPGGTGLGLAVCNEIIDAHGGRVTLQRREGGGTVVNCWIPNR